MRRGLPLGSLPLRHRQRSGLLGLGPERPQETQVRTAWRPEVALWGLVGPEGSGLLRGLATEGLEMETVAGVRGGGHGGRMGGQSPGVPLGPRLVPLSLALLLGHLSSVSSPCPAAMSSSCGWLAVTPPQQDSSLLPPASSLGFRHSGGRWV